MIGFKDLKLIIQKCCTAALSETTDINARIRFVLDVKRLEAILGAKTNLHVMAYTEQMFSEVPTIDQLQMISEYVHEKKDISYIYNGSTQAINFLLYCLPEDQESAFIDQTTGEELPPEAIYDRLNGEIVDIDLVTTLISEFPCYRVLVVRGFNKRKDKFEYTTRFRSNHNMMCYIKDLKDSGKFDANLSKSIISSDDDFVDLEPVNVNAVVSPAVSDSETPIV